MSGPLSGVREHSPLRLTANTTIWLSQSTVSGNASGFNIFPRRGYIESYGDNTFAVNGPNTGTFERRQRAVVGKEDWRPPHWQVPAGPTFAPAPRYLLNTVPASQNGMPMSLFLPRSERTFITTEAEYGVTTSH